VEAGSSLVALAIWTRVRSLATMLVEALLHFPLRLIFNTAIGVELGVAPLT